MKYLAAYALLSLSGKKDISTFLSYISRCWFESRPRIYQHQRLRWRTQQNHRHFEGQGCQQVDRQRTHQDRRFRISPSCRLKASCAIKEKIITQEVSTQEGCPTPTTKGRRRRRRYGRTFWLIQLICSLFKPIFLTIFVLRLINPIKFNLALFVH